MRTHESDASLRGIEALNYGIRVRLNGVAVDLELDTGRRETAFFLDAPTLDEVSEHRFRLVNDLLEVIVDLGTARGEGSLVLVTGWHEGRCRYDGLLGLDLLEQCVLVLRRSEAQVRCEIH